jgi:MFS transporter, ENTS family, enterobactin (siderophore) exporter
VTSEPRGEEFTGGLPAHPEPIHGQQSHAARADHSATRVASPWALRDFRIIAVGEAISAVGDAVTFTALPLLVLALTGSGTLMGIVAALQTVPDLVVGLPAGALADRWDRRRMMIVADLGRALLTALIPLSTLLAIPTIPVVLIVVAPINVLRVLFLAAWTGAIPRLVGRDLIGPASSYMEAIFAIGFIVGPGVAGLLVGRIGAPATLAIDAVSFVLSAAALYLVRTPLRGERTSPADQHLVADIREGLQFVRDHRLLRAAVAYWGLVGILTAGLIPSLTYLVEGERRQGPDAFGLIVSAYSLGTLVGALVAARLTRGNLGALLVGGGIVIGSIIVALTLVVPVETVALLGFVAGIANTFVLVSYVTIRASSTPDALLGRVGATTRMISVGLQPVGAATAGVLLDAVGGGPTLRLMGAGLIVAAVGAAFSSTLRSARGRHPEAQPATGAP